MVKEELRKRFESIQIGNISGWSKIRLCHCAPADYEPFALGDANKFSSSCPPVPLRAWTAFGHVCLGKHGVTFASQSPDIVDLENGTIL